VVVRCVRGARVSSLAPCSALPGTLGWNASTDNVGVIGYDVYRNGAKIASVVGTSSNQTGLTCGTSYPSRSSPTTPPANARRRHNSRLSPQPAPPAASDYCGRMRQHGSCRIHACPLRLVRRHCSQHDCLGCLGRCCRRLCRDRHGLGHGQLAAYAARNERGERTTRHNRDARVSVGLVGMSSPEMAVRSGIDVWPLYRAPACNGCPRLPDTTSTPFLRTVVAGNEMCPKS
jgi:hypothetical protein